jgi:hypothetical protein
MKWCFNGMHDGEIEATLFLFSSEAWLHFGGYVNSQYNKSWSAENHVLICNVPPHDGETLQQLMLHLVLFIFGRVF